MKSVKLFNSLHGKKVGRKYLEDLRTLAFDEQQWEVFYRIIKLEDTFPNAKSFILEISPKATSEEDKIYTDHSTIPQDVLDTLEEREDNEGPEGLGAPVSPDEIYQKITDRIIEMLEEDIDFEQSWDPDKEGFLYAYNFDTKKPYRGINSIILGADHIYSRQNALLANPYYLTFNQVEKHKGKILKGSKAKIAVYFTTLFRYQQAEPALEFATYDLEKMVSWLSANRSKIALLKNLTAKEVALQSKIPILKYYNVYNGNDITGIDFDLDNFKGAGRVVANIGKVEKLDVPEAIIRAYPSPSPTIRFGGDDAFYHRIKDLVQVPKIEQFKFVQAYYTTLFHELIHSTGSKDRLDRKKGAKFGDKDYSFEELVAELGASFLSAESGMLHYTMRNSAAYIKSWRGRLLTILKKDNRFFFRAASKAQAAVDFMLDRNADGIPRYIRTLDVPKTTEKIPIKAKNVPKRKVNVPKEAKNVPKAPVRKRKKGNKAQLELGLVGAKKKRRSKRGLASPIVLDEGKALIPGAQVQAPDPQPSVIDLPVVSEVVPSSPIPVASAKKKKTNKNPLVESMDELDNPNAKFFRTSGPLGRFLGKVEVKPKGSVVTTLDAPQGAMKTRFFFQIIKMLIENGYGGRILFISLEEDKNSSLFRSKRDMYIPKEMHGQVDVVSELPNGESDLEALIPNYEITLTDSFGKLAEIMPKNFNMDRDLRRKYDGKWFHVIYQRTTSGSMRGGASAQFDGDQIMKIEKDVDYTNNYAYFDKNRYQVEDGLKYNIHSQSIIEKETVPEQGTGVIELA